MLPCRQLGLPWAVIRSRTLRNRLPHAFFRLRRGGNDFQLVREGELAEIAQVLRREPMGKSREPVPVSAVGLLSRAVS